MSDFSVEIATTSNILEIESSIGNSLNFNEVSNTIETTLFETINGVLEVEATASDVVQISTEYAGTVVFASDIIGLENFLSNFIDSYEIDCGSP
jgi:hypothetical protein